MNITELFNVATSLMNAVSKAGKATNNQIKELQACDECASDFQDTADDGEQFIRLYELREEIAAVLGGECVGTTVLDFA
jgi:hypothetical protein